MHWAVPFIGKKPEEVGYCWGLLRSVYATFGVDLPTVEGLTLRNSYQMAAIVRSGFIADWEIAEKPFDGCAVGMSQLQEIHHVGIYAAADGGKIVHCWSRHNVIADSPNGLSWKGLRIVKFYRHRSWPIS